MVVPSIRLHYADVMWDASELGEASLLINMIIGVDDARSTSVSQSRDDRGIGSEYCACGHCYLPGRPLNNLDRLTCKTSIVSNC